MAERLAWLGQELTDRLELENYSAYLRSKRPLTGGAEGHGAGGELRTVVAAPETTSASPVGFARRVLFSLGFRRFGR